MCVWLKIKPRLIYIFKRVKLSYEIYYYCYLFFISNLKAQNSVKINYIVFPTGGTLERNEDVLKSKLSRSFYGVDDVLKKLEYELLIDGSKSFFHLISSLDFDENLLE